MHADCSPASAEVIRCNGALVLSRTHPVLTSPASPAVFSMTVADLLLEFTINKICTVVENVHTANDNPRAQTTDSRQMWQTPTANRSHIMIAATRMLTKISTAKSI